MGVKGMGEKRGVLGVACVGCGHVGRHAEIVIASFFFFF